MWIMVLFDLPSENIKDKKIANSFRNLLLDNGFSRYQYSNYVRYTLNKEHSYKYIHSIEANIPSNGSVSIICFTDKQYNIIKSFNSKKPQKPDYLLIY